MQYILQNITHFYVDFMLDFKLQQQVLYRNLKFRKLCPREGNWITIYPFFIISE